MTAQPHTLPTDAPPRWIARDLPASDSVKMLTLFREVFGHELGEPMQRWKYGGNHGQAFGAWTRDGSLVAHYGGFVRSLSMLGKDVVALEIGDVMVRPSERAVMTRHGAFFILTSSFFDHYVGSQQPYALAFGFPNRRHIRIGQRLGLYASVEQVFLRSWPSGGDGLPFWITVEPLFDRPDWERQADKLWREMRGDTGGFVLVRRDSAYLRYRYLDRPDGGYRACLLRNRLTGSPKAIVMVKVKEDRVDWLDFVGPRSAISLATNVVQQLAQQSARPTVFAWLTECMLKDFSARGGKVDATDVEIAQSDWNHSKGLSEKTRGKWWLMYGDTDCL